MTNQTDNQNAKLNSRILLAATWLWILAGTLSVGLVLSSIVNVNTSKLGYYESGYVLGLGFILGGIVGGFLTRLLPRVIKWQKTGWILSLILPILLISLFLFKNPVLGSIYVVFFVLLGLLGSAYVVWIPRLIKRLRGKFQKARWVVVVAVGLILTNTICILSLTVGMMGQ